MRTFVSGALKQTLSLQRLLGLTLLLHQNHSDNTSFFVLFLSAYRCFMFHYSSSRSFSDPAYLSSWMKCIVWQDVKFAGALHPSCMTLKKDLWSSTYVTDFVVWNKNQKFFDPFFLGRIEQFIQFSVEKRSAVWAWANECLGRLVRSGYTFQLGRPGYTNFPYIFRLNWVELERKKNARNEKNLKGEKRKK